MSIEVRANGLLIAGYQPAAKLTNCIVQRGEDKLNNQLSSFSSNLLKVNQYWVKHPSDLILFMDRVFWWWAIKQIDVSLDSVSGMVWGDPIITTWLPPSLTEWAWHE